ncbi:MAG: RtcB family protein [Clostridia bacterium]|nr:RtcB family protein [Clostridia bacterium]
MIELKGKRNTAIIYSDKIDKEAKTQLAALLREPAYSDSKIRIMPDVHSSKGTVVGTAMTLSGRVSPGLIGVDIGCGMETVNLGKIAEPDLFKLDALIHADIPAGAKVRRDPLSVDFPLDKLICRDSIKAERAMLSLGTLGGGNHFIELDKDDDGCYYLVIHSGSRALGSEMANHYLNAAYKYQCGKARRITKRSSDRDSEAGGFQKLRSKQTPDDIRKETAVLEGELFDAYLHDMAIVQDFAALNRRLMAKVICEGMDIKPLESFTCVHNFIDSERMILRKGAISARSGEQVIIPLNMRDGAILGRGLGNPDWNFSAPHGAGRICNRTEAKHAYTVEQFRYEMRGIFTTTANHGSLDECPMAYKPPERIIEAIGDTITVEKILKPVYNFKAC